LIVLAFSWGAMSKNFIKFSKVKLDIVSTSYSGASNMSLTSTLTFFLFFSRSSIFFYSIVLDLTPFRDVSRKLFLEDFLNFEGEV